MSPADQYVADVRKANNARRIELITIIQKAGYVEELAELLKIYYYPYESYSERLNEPA